MQCSVDVVLPWLQRAGRRRTKWTGYATGMLRQLGAVNGGGGCVGGYWCRQLQAVTSACLSYNNKMQ